MSYADVYTGHQRLCILRHLAAARGRSGNCSLLKAILEDFGLIATRDQVRTILSWLAEQGLVTLSHPTDAVTVATLTERGLEVANGDAVVPGVEVPSSRLKHGA